MPQFTYFRDTKMTIWQRKTFIIEDHLFQDCTLIDETAKAISHADNGGAA